MGTIGCPEPSKNDVLHDIAKLTSVDQGGKGKGGLGTAVFMLE